MVHLPYINKRDHTLHMIMLSLVSLVALVSLLAPVSLMKPVSLVAYVNLGFGLGFGTLKILSTPSMKSLSSVYMLHGRHTKIVVSGMRMH